MPNGVANSVNNTCPFGTIDRLHKAWPAPAVTKMAAMLVHRMNPENESRRSY